MNDLIIFVVGCTTVTLNVLVVTRYLTFITSPRVSVAARPAQTADCRRGGACAGPQHQHMARGEVTITLVTPTE
ncbi:hypothetical protein JYU34_011974 [Plutella xylostella]|uniref:Uncharacterized protein n=1 Tax=Plutella xylostella TaxID=51655 RepID=A0ABQ7QFA6_PLUXY|nr:hypothetical protein JYU34_011974 [Plutella xylostella]